MTKVEPIFNESVKTEREELHEEPLSQSPLDHIFQKLSRMELLAKEHFERYLRHKVRLNHKPRTLSQSYTTNTMFLDFYQGFRQESIGRGDQGGFGSLY